MIKKILFAVVAFLLMSTSVLVAQESDDSMNDEAMEEEESNPFPPKPKNMWEVGLQGGTMFVSGDVSPKYPLPFSGYGVGLHVRKAINYTFSLRLEGNYGQTVGIDKTSASYSNVSNDLDLAALGYSPGDRFVRNYQTTIWEGSLQGILNMGNIFFHGKENKWNIYLMAGVGIMSYQTSIDALDADGNPYDFETGFTNGSNVDERSANQDQFLEITDGDFETDAQEDNTGFVLYKDDVITPNFQTGLGISRKISDRFNVGLEHKVIISDNDFIDGFSYRTNGDKTNSADLVQNTSLQLNFNIGSKEKLVEPLYWVNPLVSPMEDLAEVKARPVLDLTDSDNDGVIDMWDEDPETEEGVAVDVKGRPLDTDGDGIPDHKDKEKFSPSGADVDENGVAMLDDPYLKESQVKDLINNRLESAKVDWFLPMIHFDLDKYYIKPQYVPALSHVASVLKNNPNVKIEVRGYADNRASTDYNQVLSYNRADAAVDYLVENFNISRDRLLIMYGGEDSPLIPGIPDSYNIDREQEYMQYMNRRVEFNVAPPGAEEMSKPEGPEAGSATPGSARKGSKYSGNRGSGY